MSEASSAAGGSASGRSGCSRWAPSRATTRKERRRGNFADSLRGGGRSCGGASEGPRALLARAPLHVLVLLVRGVVALDGGGRFLASTSDRVGMRKPVLGFWLQGVPSARPHALGFGSRN